MDDKIASTRQMIAELEARKNLLPDAQAQRLRIQLKNARGVAWWHVAWSIVGSKEGE